jgi:hypothetical protein
VAELGAELANLENDEIKVATNVDKAEIQRRRSLLESDKNLKMVFDSFWLCFQVHCGADGLLTLPGYIKFHESLQHSLLGSGITSVINSRGVAEADYAIDTGLYGPLNQTAFYDILFETVATWSNITNAAAYSAFSWALLECIADLKVQPPRLRPLREVTYMDVEDNNDTVSRRCQVTSLPENCIFVCTIGYGD